MTSVPWDQRLARLLVRSLAGTPVRPNHITTLSLALAFGAGALYARGEAVAANWAAALFVLARFLDHSDGELAGLTGRTSRLGYYSQIYDLKGERTRYNFSTPSKDAGLGAPRWVRRAPPNG